MDVKQNINRDFKGIWIDKAIWLDTKLTIMEKVFLAEISSLDNSEGCFASNKYFAGFFGISKSRCTQIIKSLEEKNYLKITLERNGKVITKRVLRVVNILNTPIKNIKQGYLENAKDNNTSINNTKREMRALDFLNNNYPSEYEVFQMQYKKQIKNWDKFIEDFNDTVLHEQLDYNYGLFGRLRKYARNWIDNSKRFTVIKNDQQPTALDKIKVS